MLKGKSIIVTGAAGALGRAAVKAVENVGGRTILFGRSLPDELIADRVHFEFDLTDENAVSSVVSKVGDFHGIFNIAGGFVMGQKAYEDSNDWAKMMALNVDTVRYMMNAAIPILLAKGSGSIVNIGAFASLRPAPDMSAYAISKRAVMSLTENLAEEVRGHGVNVNAVLPTILDTKANRDAMPDADHSHWVCVDRLAQVMVFLTSDMARDIHGALIPVRGRS